MAKVTKEVYEAYAKRITSVLSGEDFFEKFSQRVHEGASLFKLGKKRLIQDIALDWIDTIEDVLPNLDTIVRNPRKFIVQEEDIVDVALARSISTESVKFLAQHTNMISKVDKDGSVTPSKILNISKEESFEIYENRFIYTLLLKLKDFVSMRYDKIKKATATLDILELDMESRFNLPSKKVTFKTEYMAQLSFDEVMRLDPDTLTKIERVAKMDRIITDFLSSPFAKSLRGAAPVRPPIMRTNVILKNPDFKKALTLWQFIENYQANAGFSTSDEVEDYPIESQNIERLKEMVTLNTMLFESMYDQAETDMDMEDKEFADILKVGKMDFEKDKVERDEYSQQLDEEKENEEDEENQKDIAGKLNEEAETDKSKDIATEANEEIETEEKEEVEAKANEDLMSDETKDVSVEKDQDADESVDLPPEIEFKEKIVEVEKIVEIEKEVEVEIEKLIEMPPKADQEEVDLDPDADVFDQHLFEVRKLYKRPDDDKVKQEDIIKVKDAIDRCLTSYRRIKQEEIDERDRQDRINKRKEDIKKRAAAFKKQREELETAPYQEFSQSVYFGMDPFSFQKAKIAKLQEKEGTEKKEKSLFKYLNNETLDFGDKDIEGINKAIKDMELQNALKLEKDALIDKNLDSTMDMLLPMTHIQPAKSSNTKPQTNKPKEDNKEKVEVKKPRVSLITNEDEYNLSRLGVGDIHFSGMDTSDPFSSTYNLGLTPKIQSASDKKAGGKKATSTNQPQTVIQSHVNKEEIVEEPVDEVVDNQPVDEVVENHEEVVDNNIIENVVAEDALNEIYEPAKIVVEEKEESTLEEKSKEDEKVEESIVKQQEESEDNKEDNKDDNNETPKTLANDLSDMMAMFEEDEVAQKAERSKAEDTWNQEQEKLEYDFTLDESYDGTHKIKKRKKANTEKVDESKVGVGTIHIKGMSSNFFDNKDPFGDNKNKKK